MDSIRTACFFFFFPSVWRACFERSTPEVWIFPNSWMLVGIYYNFNKVEMMLHGI